MICVTNAARLERGDYGVYNQRLDRCAGAILSQDESAGDGHRGADSGQRSDAMKDVCSPLNKPKGPKGGVAVVDIGQGQTCARVRTTCDGKPQRWATAGRDLGRHLGHARGWPQPVRSRPVSATGASRMNQFCRGSAVAVYFQSQLPVARRFAANRVPRPSAISSASAGRGRVIPLRGRHEHERRP